MDDAVMQELQKLRDENARLRQECLRARRQELVEHLFRGEFLSGASIAADLRAVGIDIRKESFVELYVNVLTPPPMPRTGPDGQSEPPSGFREIYEDGLGQVISEIFPDYFCTAIRLGTGVSAILQMDKKPQEELDEAPRPMEIPPEDNFVEDLNRRAMQLIDRLSRESRLDTFVAISRPHGGVEHIPDAHQEILEICNYRSAMDIDVPLLCYHDFEMAEQEQHTAYSILNLEHNYLTDIELGDYEKAKEVIHTLIDVEFHQTMPSLYTLRTRLSAKLDLLLITLEHFQSKEEQNLYTEVTAVQQELERGTYTVQELRDQIDRIFDCIAELESRKQAPKWLGGVLRYIDENFSSVDLNVASISGVFGLNASYLTREVKRCTGSGLLDLLQKKRLECALNMMSAGAGMAEAAEKSGFGDVRALRRAMNRYQGADK